MQVIVVNDFATNTGGANRVAIDTCLALAEGGDSPHLVHGGAEVDEQLRSCPGVTTTKIGVRDVAAAPGIRSACSYLWSWQAYRECRDVFSEIARQKPAVVHVHSYGRCLSPAVFSAARSLRLPVVLTLHDYFAFSPNGLHYDFSRDAFIHEDATPFQLLRNTDRRLTYHVLRSTRMVICKALKLIPQGIHHFIAVSKRSGEFASRFLPGERISTIYSPIQKLAGQAEPWRQQEIVFVGRLSSEKGVVQLARSARTLDIPLRFVGDGVAADAVRAANPNVRITGWQDAEGVRAALQQARAVVLPSRWHETFGICVAEAMSLGVPVIVSKWAGSSEWVRDGRDGLIFDPYLEGDLERALGRIRADAPVRNMAGEAYRGFSKRDTSRAHYAAQLQSLYQELLNEPIYGRNEYAA